MAAVVVVVAVVEGDGRDDLLLVLGREQSSCTSDKPWSSPLLAWLG